MNNSLKLKQEKERTFKHLNLNNCA